MIRQSLMLDGADVTGVGETEESAFAAENGFDAVELNMECGFAVDRIDPDCVGDLATRYGLDLRVHFPYRLDAGSLHDHVREGSCRELEAALDVYDVPDPLSRTGATMCLDAAHAHVSGMDLAEQAAFLQEHGDRISHVHLNDTRRDDDDEHLLVGLVRLDFGPLGDADPPAGVD